MERLAFFFLLGLGMLAACTCTTGEQLLGKWKLDSAYYHYNQFSFSSGGWHQEEIYEFLPSGETRTLAQGSFISNAYELEGNQLIYLDESGLPSSTYEILALDRNHLVLRAEKQPLFKGGNQNRFEIRYFSRFD